MMSKIKILNAVLKTVTIGLGICAFGLTNKVSQKVQEAFTIKFPDAKKVKWEMDLKAEWEAEFNERNRIFCKFFGGRYLAVDRT